ncbi:DNA polymerase III subunit gamma/tau [Breoghania sp. L-A4]|uniref:DNA polymerase III subunit gamma/tau n=1 Tax=Breoghania sp. L-A4 TaxID=2304600 RepID=UPI000E358830|nr:DNA polymerase III subunit gamma/tau [Breoghania sp. L-A4]AXS39022.1 DNA polymerase III subunit gamma/tau [Breoghania sp. L-A4]
MDGNLHNDDQPDGTLNDPVQPSLIPTPDATKDDGAYRVLARKYRPRDFTDLIGQEPMVRTLSNAFETGRIAQAWMLTGVRGVGKTTTARILARALNYEIPGEIDQPTIALERLGIHCQAIMDGGHIDVIEMDAASHTGIDDIREITDAARYRPVSARYKVYIIDEVHMLSKAAFNGLLKTLEEPPEHVKFIFATTEIRKVPVTVLSRCQRFDLRRVEAETLVKHLRRISDSEKVAIEDEALAMVARAAEGSVRDSLSLLDQAMAHGAGTITADELRGMLGLADRARVIDLFEHVMKGDAAAALDGLREQYDVGADPAVIMSDLAEFVHLVTRLKVVPDAGNDTSVTETERTRGKAFAEALSMRVLGRAWQMLLKAVGEVQTAPKPLAAADMALIRLCYAADLPTPDDALRQLRGTQQAAPAAPAGGGPAAGGGGQPGGHAQQAPAQQSAPPAGAPSMSALQQGAPRLQAITGGQQAAHQPKHVPQPEPQTAQSPPEPALSDVPSETTLTIGTLEDVAALAAQNRDISLKFAIERQIRLIAIQPGRLDIAIDKGAAADLAGVLGRKLSDWTGQRWLVAVSRAEPGAQTIHERREADQAQLVTDARANPAVSAVLDAFPGSEIVDVRVLEGEDTDVLDASPDDETDDDD